MDEMKEFKELLSRIEEAVKECGFGKTSVDKLMMRPFNAIERELSKCIENYEKREERENRPTTVDFGEPLPTMLSKQADFGEDK